MAITAFSLEQFAGTGLNSKGTAMDVAVGTAVLASDGFKYVYASATSAYSSTANLTLGSGALMTCLTAGSALLASFVCRTGGGVLANTHFWARSKKRAALT